MKARHVRLDRWRRNEIQRYKTPLPGSLCMPRFRIGPNLLTHLKKLVRAICLQGQPECWVRPNITNPNRELDLQNCSQLVCGRLAREKPRLNPILRSR